MKKDRKATNWKPNQTSEPTSDKFACHICGQNGTFKEIQKHKKDKKH